jgi:hypothetical protein
MVMLAEEHPPVSNTIEKFPFATDTNATDIGDLTQARSYLSGQSSSVSGYSSGGDSNPPVRVILLTNFHFLQIQMLLMLVI